MAEKTASNYLGNLVNFLAGQNPALIEAVKVFQDLDQVEYELGLLDMEDTTASKVSWWPVITVMGTASSGKSEFVNRYLKSNVLNADAHSGSEKVTVFQHSVKQNGVTLPGTALDGDPRFPFYRTSKKIEEVAKGQGHRINRYLELKTSTSAKLKSKILIDMPELLQTEDKVCHFLFQHVIEMSDLVLVFLDAGQPKQMNLEPLLSEMARQQDPDKFIYIVNQKNGQETTPFAEQEVSKLKQQLINLGMKPTQFFVLDKVKAKAATISGSNMLSQIAGHKPTDAGIDSYPELEAIEERMENVNIHRAYLILNSLEKSIRANEEVFIPEVKHAIGLWKERSHFTLALIVAAGASLLVFFKIHLGTIGFLFDPIIGPIILAVCILLLIPIYLLISKTQAKFILNSLYKRKQIEGLLENPAGLFEKNLTTWRKLMPIREPVGWDNSIRERLQTLLVRAKDLFQYLNDGFSR